MRILYIDCDSLRPDHLSCYGYRRDTSPHIDRLAARGIRFNNCYTSDAPCLPSRTALMTGRLGIHSGVVGHGGTAADLRLEGPGRGFSFTRETASLAVALRLNGYRTALVSSFAERHNALWFYQGFQDIHNCGLGGYEIADDVSPRALEWIDRNGSDGNWFLYVNFWDPHTPYRTPAVYGNPFENEPLPAWHTEEIRARNYAGFGPHSARETWGFTSELQPYMLKHPKAPREIASMDDYTLWIDGYDTGIRYMDDHIGRILDRLEKLGIAEDTAVIITADHGENQGELNVYGDHQTADHCTSRIPAIVYWPGVVEGPAEADHLLYHLDVCPTIAELTGAEACAEWDGVSFAPILRGESVPGRPYLVVSQCAWSCQRAARWDQWLLIRTYHAGLKDFPPYMLFDVANDPHELRNLADDLPHVRDRGIAIIEEWTANMMSNSPAPEDPLWTVMREGGPFHTRDEVDRYLQRLRDTGRGHHAEHLVATLSR